MSLKNLVTALTLPLLFAIAVHADTTVHDNPTDSFAATGTKSRTPTPIQVTCTPSLTLT